MRQRGYAIGFLLVLLTACAGAFVGGNFLWKRLQDDFQPRQVWQPPTVVANPETVLSSPAPEVLPATVTSIPIPVPVAPTFAISVATPMPGRPTPLWAATAPGGTSSPTPTATSSPETGDSQGYQIELARPVRNTIGDCPGNYILGVVTDKAGNPLAGVSLWLLDEYGNEETTISKSGAGDMGQYDFPLFGPPRRFYLTVVDPSGRPISPRVEIAHGLGADPSATCHWVDWARK